MAPFELKRVRARSADVDASVIRAPAVETTASSSRARCTSR